MADTPEVLKPPAMPPQRAILRLAELSFVDLQALDRNQTVVLFVVSPFEEHGPHLPVGTDLFTADFFCGELSKRIICEKPAWTVLIGPSVPVGASVFEEAGSLRVRARTVRHVALEYGAALARQGFRYILLINGHGGPQHIVALEEAAGAVSRRHRVRMLSVSGPVLWQFMHGKHANRVEKLLQRPLTPREREALQGDTHAGLWETSLMLLIRPDLVKAAYANLPSSRFALRDLLHKNYPLRRGNKMGYIGTPSEAQAEFGDAARQILNEMVWEIVRPVFEVHNKKWRRTSWLYKIPFLRTGFPYVIASLLLLLTIYVIFQWMR